MPIPNFTDDEQYLINFAKSRKASSQPNPYIWGYLVGGTAVAGFGAYHDNVPVMATTFVVVCGLRIHEELFQSRWLPLWRSIITNYEAAATCESIKAAAHDEPGR